MRRVVTVTGMALALLAGPGRAQVSSATPDPHARELARALVAEDPAAQTTRSKISPILESTLTGQIGKTLDVTTPDKKDKIGVVVHSGVQAMWDDMIETRVSALAQTFTIQELEGALAFHRSPTWQAYLSANPELSRELGAALYSDPPAADPSLSEQKLALINRILKARDVEGSARKGWRVLSTTMAQAVLAFGLAKDAASPPASSNNQALEDAYAKRVVAVETRFYAKAFSNEQLTDLAAYFEGPIGRAEMERQPQLASVAASEMPNIFKRRFERIDEKACEAVSCSATERATLDAQFAKLSSMMAVVANSLSH